MNYDTWKTTPPPDDEPPNDTHRMELIVGNIGCVGYYNEGEFADAIQDFYNYAASSHQGHGREAGERVTLFYNDDIIAEYTPGNDESRANVMYVPPVDDSLRNAVADLKHLIGE